MRTLLLAGMQLYTILSIFVNVSMIRVAVTEQFPCISTMLECASTAASHQCWSQKSTFSFQAHQDENEEHNGRRPSECHCPVLLSQRHPTGIWGNHMTCMPNATPEGYGLLKCFDWQVAFCSDIKIYLSSRSIVTPLTAIVLLNV